MFYRKNSSVQNEIERKIRGVKADLSSNWRDLNRKQRRVLRDLRAEYPDPASTPVVGELLKVLGLALLVLLLSLL